MTDQEALVEARDRWGPMGFAWHSDHSHPDDSWYCCVGTKWYNGRKITEGHGSTWEAAFKDADNKISTV